MKVLIADDNDLSRESLMTIVEARGHTVVAVTDGDELLKKLQSGEHCDFIVTDNNMPGMTGLGVLRALRESRRFKDLPVIIYSADWNREREVKESGGKFAKKGARGDLTAALQEVEDQLLKE